MTQQILARLVRTLVPVAVLLGMSTLTIAATIVLPAGQGCPDFGVTIDLSGADHRVTKTFSDKNGNPVRFLAAGQGTQFVFTNSSTGVTLTVKTGGSVEHITPNADRTQTWVTSGHELVILFPSDTPPGPASTLYIGRLVFRLDPSSFTFLGIQSFTGRSIDICAALAG
jgi:hypothetical protein